MWISWKEKNMAVKMSITMLGGKIKIVFKILTCYVSKIIQLLSTSR